MIDGFTDLVSYDQVRVTVESDERALVATLSAQQALASLIGLIMASSGCPRTAVFRPMARFHLPFSSESETAYRVAAMYLLAQHFAARSGGKPDLALNLISKINENPAWSWATDLHLGHAMALHGVGKDQEALELLNRTLMSEGWAEKHKTYTLESVLLKARGQDWPTQVGLKAAALEVELLAATGQLDPARTLHSEAVAVYGDKPELSAALPPPPEPPPAPEPASKKKPR